MESSLHKVVDDILSNQGVTGVLCADKNGLCLAAKGAIERSTSGSLVHLMQLATKLEPSKVPILRLNSESKEVLVKNEGGFTLAIVKDLKK